MKNKQAWFGFLALALVMGFLISLPKKAEAACSNCTGTTYQQICAKRMLQYGYDGLPGVLCAPIRSAAALRCAEGLITHRYSPLDYNDMYACGMATECSSAALDALFNNGYNTLTAEFIATVARTRSIGRAECYKTLFDNHYGNLTPENIQLTCPR